jgi:NAD+ synthase
MSVDCGCVLGRIEQMIRFTVWNSGAAGVVIGVSGGVDSAVGAAMCCKALSGENVLGLTLPSAVTSDADIRDAAELCRELGMRHEIVTIEPVLAAYRLLPGYTESPALLGNLMARTRMAILYYYANRDNRLVCGTSNRTEYMLGYTTKFGDNAADFQPILHLYKNGVYEAAREIGVPGTIIKKAPSAGLWHGQKDEDEIGLTYAEIDGALVALEANDWKATTPVQEKVLAMVKKSGHKRMTPSLLY